MSTQRRRICGSGYIKQLSIKNNQDYDNFHWHGRKMRATNKDLLGRELADRNICNYLAKLDSEENFEMAHSWTWPYARCLPFRECLYSREWVVIYSELSNMIKQYFNVHKAGIILEMHINGILRYARHEFYMKLCLANCRSGKQALVALGLDIIIFMKWNILHVRYKMKCLYFGLKNFK